MVDDAEPDEPVGDSVSIVDKEDPPARFEAVGYKRPNATIDSPGPNRDTSLTTNVQIPGREPRP
jgi:hypothetical protein